MKAALEVTRVRASAIGGSLTGSIYRLHRDDVEAWVQGSVTGQRMHPAAGLAQPDGPSTHRGEGQCDHARNVHYLASRSRALRSSRPGSWHCLAFKRARASRCTEAFAPPSRQ